MNKKRKILIHAKSQRGKGRKVIKGKMRRKAVILLSGGIDSSTTLFIARDLGFELYALTIQYGQRHLLELESATKVAKQAGVAEHKTIEVDLRSFGGSALTGEVDVPKKSGTLRTEGDIPVTYVPARNTVFLSLALSWAEALQARHIFIGANVIDYSGYPDCRPEFIKSFEKLANVATKAGVEGYRFSIQAPLIEKSKSEIIKLGKALGLDFSLTHSCYDPEKDGKACGICASCLIRLKGFEEAGFVDPISYMESKEGF